MRFPALIFGLTVLAGLALASPSRAAVVIYDDAIHEGWASWSWGGDFDFENTEPVLGGTYCISAALQQYGALSFHADQPFRQATALSFWLRGSSQDLVLYLTADSGDDQDIESDQIPISDLAEVTADDWAFVSADLAELDDAEWTRFNFMFNGVGTMAFLMDEIVLQGVEPTLDEPLDEPPDQILEDDPVEGQDDAPAEDVPDAGLEDAGLEDASLEGDDLGEGTAEQETDAPEQEEDGGWGCRTVPGPAGSTGWLLLIAVALFWRSIRRGGGA